MGKKVGLVVAEYNGEITSSMREEAEDAAQENDADVEVVHVPGSYDTPLAAQKLADRDDIDCVTVIGAIIEGDTDHDKIIGNSTAKTLQEVSLESGKPVTMAITGPGMTAEEAYERTHYAYDAVESALEMTEELGDL
jgi:6,7-dimethyl-8-ribityllumazine synthase